MIGSSLNCRSIIMKKCECTNHYWLSYITIKTHLLWVLGFLLLMGVFRNILFSQYPVSKSDNLPHTNANVNPVQVSSFLDHVYLKRIPECKFLMGPWRTLFCIAILSNPSNLSHNWWLFCFRTWRSEWLPCIG